MPFTAPGTRTPSVVGAPAEQGLEVGSQCLECPVFACGCASEAVRHVERPPSEVMQPPDASSASSPEASVQQDPQGLETFEELLFVRHLPIVIFSDDVTEQRVWHNGSVTGGRVERPDGPPDVRACNPVVMSPAFLGFAIEPYEKRYLHYRGVGIVFARPFGGTFMQPSIDTILVCCALAKLFEVVKPLDVRRAVDIGSGSGFLGKFAAAHVPGTDGLSMTLVDIDPKAMEYCQQPGFNATRHGYGGRRVSWTFCAEDAIQHLDANQCYDLIVSNPPYVPTVAEASGCEESREVSGFWEGVGLVIYLIKLVLNRRCPPGAHLVLLITSLTLKSPQVRGLLGSAPARGVRVRQLLEREIAWKAWYAGPRGLDHLLASPEEHDRRRRIGECEFFVGATEPGNSRTGSDGRDRFFNYHWHVAYVLDLWGSDRPPAAV
uniref:Methyltransferase small domain-containing protein n=1 Tax=Alexandrium monilatum TaxID=311494 RepID=A0A7S4Q1U4_9DINO|mmetsp:Transcript_90638/g.270470  ORF Transcript_90638/g.270470 Transcript_90638/m.270470 type:complete len:434 (+) Transcript_90638:53-1354(+)|eukprot:CAMPEP_0175356810 /NCGR_PEP_ID=MMETSP0095-20121207/14172_1 /TAXON_ID=311494 /ORGANISM="Alexandrium monilatum, Strain CCMP3105" /LENGTH=433 /DNA_ID=CAMNT_0016654515 /DNA_START=29 /DNA_END=1330 /DNA_ORIENTATION=-